MAVRELFVDTSALYAFVNRRDEHHALTNRLIGRIAQAGRMLVVTDYVIAETLNLATVRGGSHVALRVLDLLDQTTGIRMERIDFSRFEMTKTFFRKHSDHGYSFTDCSSFVVMRELRLKEALTTDRHFISAGFRCPLLV